MYYARQISDYETRIEKLDFLGMSFYRAGFYKKAEEVYSIIESDFIYNSYATLPTLENNLIICYLEKQQHDRVISIINKSIN